MSQNPAKQKPQWIPRLCDDYAAYPGYRLANIHDYAAIERERSLYPDFSTVRWSYGALKDDFNGGRYVWVVALKWEDTYWIRNFGEPFIKDIRHISVGEKAKLRWGVGAAAVYALGPLGALTLFWKKKMAMFGLEYQDGKGTQSILFGVKKKIGFQMSQQLEEVSGKSPDFEAGSGGKVSKK